MDKDPLKEYIWNSAHTTGLPPEGKLYFNKGDYSEGLPDSFLRFTGQRFQEVRLGRLDLCTLQFKITKGDLIETHKILMKALQLEAGMVFTLAECHKAGIIVPKYEDYGTSSLQGGESLELSI